MSLLVPWKLKAALRPLPFSAAVSLSQAAPASWHQWRWPSSRVSDHGDVLPQGLVALSGTRTVSLAGWWLVAVSRAQQCEYGDGGRGENGDGGRGVWSGDQQRGPGGCAGTRPTVVPCPSAPTLPVAAPQPGGVPGEHCHPALPPAPHGCLGPALAQWNSEI